MSDTERKRFVMPERTGKLMFSAPTASMEEGQENRELVLVLTFTHEKHERYWQSGTWV